MSVEMVRWQPTTAIAWLRRRLPRRRPEPDWDGLLKAMNDAQLKADEALAKFRRIVEERRR